MYYIYIPLLYYVASQEKRKALRNALKHEWIQKRYNPKVSYLIFLKSVMIFLCLVHVKNLFGFSLKSGLFLTCYELPKMARMLKSISSVNKIQFVLLYLENADICLHMFYVPSRKDSWFWD